MTRRIRRLKEPLIGKGILYSEGKRIADVQYRLRVEQEYLAIADFDGTEEVEGHCHVAGSVTVVEGDDYLIGKDDLILRLEGGRGLPVLVASQQMGTWVGGIRVVGSGDFITPDEMHRLLGS